MTTLAADKSRAFEIGDYNDLPVIASDIIYEGAAVGNNGSNGFRPLAAGDPFAGFAEANVDNSAGAAGAKTIRVRARGRVQLPISSFDVTDLDKPVYASDDDTFTLTQSTNSFIGRAIRFVATGSALVAFGPGEGNAGLLAELTDNTGGTASGTIAAETLTDNSGGTASGTLAASGLTDNSGGTASGTLAAETLTDNSGGTATGTIAVSTLTDNSGGTASATLAAIESTYTQATVANAVAALAARINTLANSIASLAANSNTQANADASLAARVNTISNSIASIAARDNTQANTDASLAAKVNSLARMTRN